MATLLDNNSANTNSRHLVDRLRQLGLDKYIELPQIAVMGDTSSGKSSVLSALSGIAFPSSKDLTTRCPTQLILTYAKELTGTVRLVRYESNELTTPTLITTLEEITQSIERITQQLIDEGQYISDDAIEIKMQGPNFPNLTLTDLPGLVRTVADGEDEGMIKRVRKLVDRYLVQERTIILAVVPANVDMHNTEIMQAAGEVDPLGNRTVSIITKPDLIDKGAEDAVINLLMNRTKKRRLGYHVVKCRGQHALNTGVSISDGRKDEETYFATDPVWKSVDASLCGTERLADKLSKLLIETIASAMPAVFAEIDSQMKACQEELESMGPLMDNASARRSLYMQHVRVILDRIECALCGQYNDEFFHGKGHVNCLRTRLRKLDAMFMNQIEILAEVKHKEIDQSERLPKVLDLVEIRRNGKWVIDEVTSVPLQGSEVTTRSHANQWLKRGSYRFPKQLDVDGIMELINDNRGNELSIFLSYPIFCNIVTEEYVSKWKPPMFDLYEGYQQAIEEVVESAIESTKAPLLVRNHLKSTVIEVVSLLGQNITKELNGILDLERQLFTLNSDLLTTFGELRTQPLSMPLRKFLVCLINET
ncbi:interferon-induced GTP-binding protein Mx [Thraustotheca clavata]|uniref:Interferon-induced GTP-binding protein Mx n=1 Tax=Thraustotheca clavata TaxID=74557 RepID=A0A1V9YHX4_9STRA|nr:interferon-induced GTP-binding protein Mx [Thraustotheca clavata]